MEGKEMVRALTPMAEYAVKVARERAKKLLDIREALVTGDERRALDLTRDLCGLNKQDHAA